MYTVQDENAQGFTDGYSYSVKDMLQKCFARTKCTKAQIFFRVSELNISI